MIETGATISSQSTSATPPEVLLSIGRQYWSGKRKRAVTLCEGGRGRQEVEENDPLRGREAIMGASLIPGGKWLSFR